MIFIISCVSLAAFKFVDKKYNFILPLMVIICAIINLFFKVNINKILLPNEINLYLVILISLFVGINSIRKKEISFYQYLLVIGVLGINLWYVSVAATIYFLISEKLNKSLFANIILINLFAIVSSGFSSGLPKELVTILFILNFIMLVFCYSQVNSRRMFLYAVCLSSFGYFFPSYILIILAALAGIIFLMRDEFIFKKKFLNESKMLNKLLINYYIKERKDEVGKDKQDIKIKKIEKTSSVKSYQTNSIFLNNVLMIALFIFLVIYILRGTYGEF